MSDITGLTAEEEASFVTIIDSILAASDLTTISEKRIRKGLQAAVDHDITPQKEPIKALIMARFDKFMEEQNAAPQNNGHTVTTNGNVADETPEPKRESSISSSKASLKREAQEDDDDLSDAPASPSPKKKRKPVHVDDDAAFAARLQAEENGRARATRGGVNKKSIAIKKKRTPKKKTSNKVKAEDDSDLEGSGSEAEKKVNRNGGFHKLMTLSGPLSALLGGEAQLSRPQTVKRIWAYVRENDLQDPNDKRMLLCDGPMKAVFKQEKVHMFTMNKLLGLHLYAPEE